MANIDQKGNNRFDEMGVGVLCKNAHYCPYECDHPFHGGKV